MKNQYQPLTLKRITQGSLTVTFANRKKRVELVENAIYLAQDVTLQEPSDDYADEIAQFVFNAYCETVEGRPTAHGGTYTPGIYSVTLNIPFGMLVGEPFTRRQTTAFRPFSRGSKPMMKP